MAKGDGCPWIMRPNYFVICTVKIFGSEIHAIVLLQALAMIKMMDVCVQWVVVKY